MTTLGSGASYIVTSICKVIADTSTELTVYVDSEIFWFVNGLITNITRKIQAGQRMDTSSMTSRILRLHSFNYYPNIEHIP